MACNARRALIVFCVIQIIAIVEKQVFDCLCMLWTPILLNVIHLLLTVVVLVGICRYIYKLLVAYSVWCMLWMAWNVFVICFYYEIGVLNRDLPIMKLGCEQMSWLPRSFPGCPDRTPHFEDNTTTSLQDGLSTSHTFPSDETTFIHHSTFPFTEIVFEEETELLFEPQTTEPPTETLTEDWEPTESFTDEVESTVDTIDYSLVGDDDDVAVSDVSSLPVASHRRRHDNDEESISVAMISISYKALQAIHAIVQCILSICCFILTCSLAHIYSEEEDSSQPVHRDELEYVKMRVKESSSPSSFSSPPTSSSSTLPAIGSRTAWRHVTSSSSASYTPKARPLSERIVSRNYERPIDSIDLRQFYDDLEAEDECPAPIVGMGGANLRLSNCNARPKSELFFK